MREADCSTAGAHLVVSDLTWRPRRAGEDVLRQISLQAQPGRFVGVIGANGSGKSSLLRCIFRHDRPHSGQVQLDGQDVWAQTPRWCAQRIGVLPQHGPHDVPLDVEQLVATGSLPHKRVWQGESAAERERLDAVLRTLALDTLRHRPFDTLSGGEQQRALLARALMQRPRLLVLDEPTNHLDARHQLDLMRRLHALPLTKLVTLHDLNLAAAFCDSLYLLAAGCIVAAGSPEQVLTPEHLLRYFGLHARIAAHPDGGYPQILVSHRHSHS